LSLSYEEKNAMKNINRWVLVILIVAGLLPLTACQKAQSGATASEKPGPVKVEENKDGGPARITLTEKAAQRIGLKTAPVSNETAAMPQSGKSSVTPGGSKVIPVSKELGAVSPPKQRNTVPYSAIIYDAKGGVWVYTNPEPLTYVRQPVVVDTVKGDTVILSDDTVLNAAVVTVGATELYGAEFGVDGD
jgi:hypothetical protein